MDHPSCHGTTKARGCSHVRLGNFSKLFPDLPSWSTQCLPADPHAAQCEAERIAAVLGGSGGIMHDANSSSGDSGIPAAYTFFAQFIDHDITLDTTTQLHCSPLNNDEINELPNLRSASLDLDCVYGLGPEAMPFMFDQSAPGKMLWGNDVNPNDLLRNQQGRAMIGDPRNDENLFVSQIQLLFIRLHNRRLVGRNFEEAQADCRRHYQWVVLHDFLKRVCDPTVYQFALDEMDKNQYELKVEEDHCGRLECKRELDHSQIHYPKCYGPDACGRLTMPVEFSVAAYRFGHTLVRSVYPTNAGYPAIELFDERFSTLGFGAVPPELTVDWRFLLDVEECHEYAKSKAVDHLLADELIRMPDPIVGRLASANDRSLAFRNLLRGHVLGLPSGQSVAAALQAKGYDVAPDYDLEFDKIPGWLCLPEDLRTKLEQHTPLFFYLMREAGTKGGCQLGRVGSALLLEVFGGMLVHCDSFLSACRNTGSACDPLWEPWTPDPCLTQAGDLTFASLVRYVSAD